MEQLHIYLHKIIFVLLFFSLLQLSITTNALGNETDRMALLRFKESIANDPNGGVLMSSWNDSIHFCSWPGITCSHGHHKRVTALNLVGYDLRGSISPFIGNLTFLKFINLVNNSFYGEIPPEVGHLQRLQHLNLTNNMLAGEIPVSLINCSELRVIDLGSNRLMGNIPKKLGSLMKLETFQVRRNNLIGGIPPSIGNLSSSFKYFSSGYNNLEGNIPEEISRLKSLNYFSAPVNKLYGIVPPSLYNQSSISFIQLADNQLNGTLPVDMGFSLPNLQRLAIAGNQFSGQIPTSLSNASRLQILDLATNKFVGQVPSNLGNLKDVIWLNFGQNNFGSNSSNDLEFLTSLANCSKLQILGINSNKFGGLMPDSIGNLSMQLSELYLGENYMYGSIPAALENLLNLNALHMEYNFFTGAIPKSLAKLEKLQILTLNQNRLSGEIPSLLANLTQLFILSLSHNKFEGKIPPIIGNLRNLQSLDISKNNLSGTIPLQVFDLPSLSLLLNLSQNSLTGSLPVQVGNLNKLYAIDLSANNLSGEIPSTIGDCSSMEFIYLQRNFFYGKIPSSLSSVKGLSHLDLSQNNFTGKIPKEIKNLKFLLYLNMSSNNLEGEVPTEGVFQNSSAIFLTGNSKLCGGVPNLGFPACPTKGEKGRKFRVLKLAVIVTCVLLVSILSLSFSFALYRRRKSGKKSSSTLSRIEFFPMVSYRALFEATTGFSPNNLVGTGSFGSVYKATIDQEAEKIVAVKVLNLEKNGASKSFMAECKALRSIRHRNLVKILTACSSVDYNGKDFKALVFEFMENGSLEEWLHREKEDGNWRGDLNLLQRLNIIMDVASALDYLHGQCEQSIIHCDLKPSNVLLDKDMVAHISDFGLARLLSETNELQQSQTSTVGIKGTIGYTAPEYGFGGEASKQGDVYSYGILVLEILTARRPTDKMFKDGLNLHNHVKTALPERLAQIVDPNLLRREVEENMSEMDANVEKCLMSILEIGVACSVESPKERMRMVDVIRELHSIKKDLFNK